MTDKFEVMVIGYGLSSIKLFETDDEEKASDCCLKNNQKLLDSGVPGEVLTLHPQYQYYRKIGLDSKNRKISENEYRWTKCYTNFLEKK